MRYARIEVNCLGENRRCIRWKRGDGGMAGVGLGKERRYGLRLPFGGPSEEFRPALSLLTVAFTRKVCQQVPTARNPPHAALQRAALLGEVLQDLHARLIVL